MKKILMLFAAVALVLGAASCQKENFQKALAEGQEQIDYSDDPMGVIKVYIKKDDTKMAFEENTSGRLTRAFAVGDSLSGCTKVGDVFESFAYTFEGEGEDGAGDYMLLRKTSGKQGVPSAAKYTKVNFVYAPGAVSFDATTGACSLDLSKQDESHIPAVMVASGEVGDADAQGVKLTLNFENIAAVIAIRDGITLKDVNDVDVTGYKINKVYAIARTKGTLTLNNDKKKYEISAETPDEFWPTTISPKDGEKFFSADDPIYIAALPGNGKISAELRTDMGKFVWETSSAQNLGANAYARIKNKEYKQRAEAEINGTRYAIEDAFAYAQTADDNVTITMVEDAVTYEEINFTQEKSKKITLDLNDKTITSKNLTGEGRVFNTKVTNNDPKFPFEVKNGTITGGLCSIHTENDLTLTDAKFYANGKASSAVINVNSSTAKVKMERCYVEATATEPWENKWDYIRAVNVGGPTTIENCTLISPAIALRVFNSSKTNTVEVKNSECISDGNACTIYANNARPIDIESGYFYNRSKEIIGNQDDVNPIVNITGGYFNKEVNAAEGYGCKTCEPQYDSYGNQYSWNVVVSPVAQVDGVDKYNRDDAISALNSSNAESPKMTLLSNWSPSEMIVVKNENGKKVTIDFNGYTIESSVSDTAAVRTETPVKFTSTKATNDNPGGITGAYKALLVVSPNSEADGGLFSSTSTDDTKCVVQVGSIAAQTPEDNGATSFKFNDNAKVISKSGVRGLWARGVNGKRTQVEISGGEIKTKGYPLYGYAYADIVVKGDVLLERTSNYSVVYNGSSYGTVSVEDGYFKKESGTRNIYAQASNAKIIVSGGHYTQSVGTSGFAFKDGYGEYEDGEGDYKYYVAEKVTDPEVYLNGKGVASLATAVENVNNMTSQDPITIKLNKDINSGSAYKFTNTSSELITFDLNNHSITFNNRSAYLNIAQGVKALLKDGSEEKGGMIMQTAGGNTDNYSKCILVNGTVTIESGTYIMNCTKTNANNETVRTDNNAILTITGGKFEGVYCTFRCQDKSKLTVKGETSVTTYGKDQTGTGASTGTGIQVRESAVLLIQADNAGKVPTIGSTKNGAVYAFSHDCDITVEAGYFWSAGTNQVLSSNSVKKTGESTATTCAHTYKVKGGIYTKELNSNTLKQTIDTHKQIGFGPEDSPAEGKPYIKQVVAK